jgi:hypothetical protein
VKLVVEGPREKIVGLHVLGIGADEMMQVGLTSSEKRIELNVLRVSGLR